MATNANKTASETVPAQGSEETKTSVHVITEVDGKDAIVVSNEIEKVTVKDRIKNALKDPRVRIALSVVLGMAAGAVINKQTSAKKAVIITEETTVVTDEVAEDNDTD